MECFSVPGVAAGVIHGTKEAVVTLGITSVENPLEVNSDTLFQIGSISKTYTATAVMRLVEDGSLELDEPVRKYLPELTLADPAVARAVTMRHLLTHTGGFIGDYFASISRGDDALAQMVARLDRLEQLTPLGDAWSYNNAGFYIAGRVVEVVTRKPFETALFDLVLQPLNLERSLFRVSDIVLHRFAVGHHRDGKVARPWSLGRPAAPIGGLATTVRDLLTYARHQWEPRALLTHRSFAEMRQPYADAVAPRSIGLGWFLHESDGCLFVTHAGATNGQHALLVVAPERRFALAVLTNHDDGPAVYKAIHAEVLRDVLGISSPEPTPLELSPAQLAEYVGEYVAPLTVAKVAVANECLTLNLTPRGGFPEPDSRAPPGPPPTRLAFEAKDAVIALDPPLKGDRSDFLRGVNGEIVWYRSAGRLHRLDGSQT
jgi:CubicO group peptidase (beta-lactamase class C family)